MLLADHRVTGKESAASRCGGGFFPGSGPDTHKSRVRQLLVPTHLLVAETERREVLDIL